jgi:NADH-quinone oxidoreductase subunit M
VFFGPVSNPKNEKLADLSPREIVTFAPLVVLAFWIGIYPKPFFEILAPPVNKIVQTVRPDYPIARPALPREAKAPPEAAKPAPSDASLAEGNR